MRQLNQVVLLLVATALGAAGCMRSLSTLSIETSALHLRQLCPGVRYEVVGEFKRRWTGTGFLGIPLNDPPNFAAAVTKEVKRLKGDAAIDVHVSSNMYVLYLLLWAQIHPRHRLSGKVIRFTSHECALHPGRRISAVGTEDAYDVP